jgi:hypothetical protein
VEKTIINKRDLSLRWGLTERCIEEYEKKGILKRLKKFQKVHYSMKQIIEIEESQDYITTYDARAYKRECEKLKEEVQRLQNELAQIHSITINTIFRLKEGV